MPNELCPWKSSGTSPNGHVYAAAAIILISWMTWTGSKMMILIDHVAVSNAADATLTWKILVSSPSVASRKDRYGDLPLHMALAHEAAVRLAWAIFEAYGLMRLLQAYVCHYVSVAGHAGRQAASQLVVFFYVFICFL